MLKKLDHPSEIWDQHAIYQIGTKIKSLSPILYNNSEPHLYPTPKEWKDNLMLADKLNWDDEKWQESTHKALYKSVKSTKENKPNIRSKSGKEVRWEKIFQTRFKGEKLVANEEMIINYRSALDGYIFGNKKM